MAEDRASADVPLPFIRPTMPEPEAWLPYLRPAYAAHQFTNFGPVAARFAELLTAKYSTADRPAVPAASGTAALTAAIQTLTTPGRVLMPSFTFPATGHAVLAAGSTPVFCDIAPDTYELASEQVSRCLASTDVNAIIHVRAFGFCHDLRPLHELARRHGIPFIVDAAAALGGTIADCDGPAAQGDAAVFSLHATKPFGIGEGGVVFAPEHVAPRLRRALNFGLEDGDVTGAGANGKLSEFHAAVGCAVCDRIDAEIAHRRRCATVYHDALVASEMVETCPPPHLAPWQSYPILLGPEYDLADIVRQARKRGVEFRRYYRPALHWSTFFRRFAEEALPVTERVADRLLCLPIYANMTAAEQERVLDTLHVVT